VFLPGDTSHGHYQIELACNACHTPWMGVKEKACYDCHAAELKAANDSHPKSKFTDPRNADRLARINADDCVTCHREHLPEQTRAMGVTMPEDYCVHCHQETLRERPSHKDFSYTSCATSGCHNYHDNTALYEDFLVKHAREPHFKKSATRPTRNPLASLIQSGNTAITPLKTGDQDAPPSVKPDAALLHEWEGTAHAKAGVNCTGCHATQERGAMARRWSDKVDHSACASCHREETDGFLAGKHGMRLAHGLTPMLPALARLPMKREAVHRELNCVSCHGAHEFDTRKAAVDSCLSCHNDGHSLAYKQSPHFDLWSKELGGEAPTGSGVSCATCHLPREGGQADGAVRVLVQHNQNLNLRPNEKMIRSVCLDCHGLEFSIDALADAALVRNNFIGRPARHVESIDLALKRQMETSKTKSNP
jgi:predicted CXXCH cytochrome family protein